MRQFFLILIVAIFVILVTGCTTNSIVIAPPESIMKCEKVDVPEVKTNADNIAFTNRLVKANIVCYNSMNNVRQYVNESKKQQASKPK